MSTALQKKNAMSREAYLAMERASETRNEYLDGEIFAMTGASRAHNQIASNIVRALGNQLIDAPCTVFSSDMKVRIAEINKYAYPDIVAVCEDEQYEDEYGDVLLNPRVIIEILSHSTEAYDRGDKFAHYQLLDSFSEYLLAAQYACRVEKFNRRDDGTWIYAAFESMSRTVTLDAIGCSLPLAEVYRKVSFPRSRTKNAG